MNHVASWSSPATRVRTAFPSGSRGSFSVVCTTGFQGAESRSSPLPLGRSLSPFGSVLHDSHQQAVARTEARAPPFMVELFAARLSPRVPELPSPGWCASRRPSSPRWLALHGRSSRREPRRWIWRRVSPPALVLACSPRRANERPEPKARTGRARCETPYAASPTSMSTASRNRTGRSVSVVPPRRTIHGIETADYFSRYLRRSLRPRPGLLPRETERLINNFLLPRKARATR